MPLPVMQSVGADLYDRLAPLAALDEANDFAFAHRCEAIGRAWQAVADLSEDRDGRPGWAALADVETAPANALEYLSQIVGIHVTKGATEAVQRAEVRRHAGAARGRPASMIAEVQATLTGSKSVRLIERTSSAWTFTVITRTSETPDPTATAAAIERQRPGGDIVTHIISDLALIDEWTRDIDATTANIDVLTPADVT